MCYHVEVCDLTMVPTGSTFHNQCANGNRPAGWRRSFAAVVIMASMAFMAAGPSRAQSTSAGDYDSRLERAVGFYSEKRYAEAAALFEMLTKAEPARKEAFLWLGHTHARLNDWNNARESFKSYTQLAPSDVEGFREIARTYEAEGKRDLARVWYKRAADLEPTNQELKKAADAVGRDEGANKAGAAAPPSVPTPGTFWQIGLAGLLGARSKTWIRVLFVIFHVVGVLQAPIIVKTLAGKMGITSAGAILLQAAGSAALQYALFWGVPSGWTWGWLVLCLFFCVIGTAAVSSR